MKNTKKTTLFSTISALLLLVTVSYAGAEAKEAAKDKPKAKLRLNIGGVYNFGIFNGSTGVALDIGGGIAPIPCKGYNCSPVYYVGLYTRIMMLLPKAVDFNGIIYPSPSSSGATTNALGRGYKTRPPYNLSTEVSLVNEHSVGNNTISLQVGPGVFVSYYKYDTNFEAGSMGTVDPAKEPQVKIATPGVYVYGALVDVGLTVGAKLSDSLTMGVKIGGTTKLNYVNVKCLDMLRKVFYGTTNSYLMTKVSTILPTYEIQVQLQFAAKM